MMSCPFSGYDHTPHPADRKKAEESLGERITRILAPAFGYNRISTKHFGTKPVGEAFLEWVKKHGNQGQYDLLKDELGIE
jgi:hypothetical protein